MKNLASKAIYGIVIWTLNTKVVTWAMQRMYYYDGWRMKDEDEASEYLTSLGDIDE